MKNKIEQIKPTLSQIDAAITGARECEWIEADSMEGHSLGLSGFDCDDASAFLTAHHKEVLFALRFLRVMMDEPTHGMCEEGYSDKDGERMYDQAEIFKAMRDEALRIAGGGE